MPHSSSATTTMISVTKETILTTKDIPTPPHNSIELPPILNIYNRPPSPDSPKLNKVIHLHHQYHQLPLFLEPNPQIKVHYPTNTFSLDLLKTVNKAPSPPSGPPPPPPTPPPPSSSSSSSSPMLQTPLSPTMINAVTSAATFASSRHPGSQVVKTLLKSIGKKDLTHTNDTLADGIDQSMFLTKNAHIKRPRNAWIHFRCHYGQALKSQDPTLRAEEISKRASQRWSKLSENEKKPWHNLAEQEKLAHREAFPEYRYCPRRNNNSNDIQMQYRPQKKLKRN